MLLATSRSLLNNPAVPSSILVVDNGDDSALSQPSKQALATGNVVHIPGINFVGIKLNKKYNILLTPS